jgi:hypothetical protein
MNFDINWPTFDILYIIWPIFLWFLTYRLEIWTSGVISDAELNFDINRPTFHIVYNVWPIVLFWGTVMLPYRMYKNLLSRTVNFKHLHRTCFACDILCFHSKKLCFKKDCPVKINRALVVIYSAFILHSLIGTHLQHTYF